jgi:ComF family protein
MIRPWLEKVVATFYPPTCILCGAAGHEGLDLCRGCLEDMPHNTDCCSRCALPLPGAHPAGTLCGACQRHSPPFAVCRAPFRYEDPLPMLVSAAKFRGRLNAARLLGECLLRSLKRAEPPLPELIIPVPLHPRRLRGRGYNQALELARPVARGLTLPIDTRSCARAQPTAPQASLEKEARHRNVRGAFRVLQPPRAGHVAIVDDVVTTGSTVSELAGALRRAGVERVDVWAAARTE